MVDPHIHIDVRSPWRRGQSIFLLGPGGVGKSSLAGALAPALGRPCVDLDLEFCRRLGVIGPFIQRHGYQRYRAENLALAAQLMSSATQPVVMATASGFLAAPPDTPDHQEASRLVATGYGITLLPSLDVEIAAPIVVARQLTRGFGLEREAEDKKFRERFPVYLVHGDALVATLASPEETTKALISTLAIS